MKHVEFVEIGDVSYPMVWSLSSAMAMEEAFGGVKALEDKSFVESNAIHAIGVLFSSVIKAGADYLNLMHIDPAGSFAKSLGCQGQSACKDGRWYGISPENLLLLIDGESDLQMLMDKLQKCVSKEKPSLQIKPSQNVKKKQRNR